MKNLMPHRNMYSAPWLSLLFGCIGFIVFIVLETSIFQNNQVVISDVWLMFPLPIIIWGLSAVFFSRKAAQALVFVCGFSFFTLWIFCGTGVPEVGAMFVLSEKNSVGIIGLSGILLLVIGSVDFFLVQPFSSSVLVVAIIVRDFSRLTDFLQIDFVDFVLRRYLAVIDVAFFVTATSIVLYEMLLLLAKEVLQTGRRLENEKWYHLKNLGQGFGF